MPDDTYFSGRKTPNADDFRKSDICDHKIFSCDHKFAACDKVAQRARHLLGGAKQRNLWLHSKEGQNAQTNLGRGCHSG
jgi:hypothetical protein